MPDLFLNLGILYIQHSCKNEQLSHRWFRLFLPVLLLYKHIISIPESSREEMFELAKKEFLNENGTLNGDTMQICKLKSEPAIRLK